MSTTTIATLLRCIRATYEERYRSTELFAIIDDPASAIDAGRAVTRGLLTLTPRQLEVVLAVADHHGNYSAAGRDLGAGRSYVTDVFDLFLGRVVDHLARVLREAEPDASGTTRQRGTCHAA